MPGNQRGNLGLWSGYTVGDSGWGPQMNSNLDALDALAQPVIKSAIVAAPPGSPANGDAYIIPSGATGAWAGLTNQIAVWISQTSTWEFYIPKSGWKVFDLATLSTLRYTGSAWTSDRTVDIAVFAPGLGSNSQILLRLKVTRATTFPAGAALSQASASANATASTTYTLKQNGTAFATINFAAGANSGTWTQAADAIFAAGDILEIDGPATADATLANVGITLAGLR